MTARRFTSYAQNREDVLLHRALASVERGQYIDIGAADPEFNSVTKAFYDSGWSGLNVEPVDELQRRLALARPRDVTLGLALGATANPTTLYSVAEFDEISTTVAAIGQQYAAEGRNVVESKVDGSTLERVWAENVEGEVHFLKIDVEGSELAVLSGADFERQRPWIVVVEVVAFGATSADADAIDALLAAARYTKVYFDGLNNFYVADEHRVELEPAFAVPVNVTDDYRLPAVSTAEYALSRVAESLGAAPDADAREVIERILALTADRIAFENQVTELVGDPETDESDGIIAALSDERDAAVEALEVAAADLATARSLAEAQYQLSFERERHLAIVTAQAQDYHGQIFGERRAAQLQLQAVYRSSSWRASLPLRAARHPVLYLRKLFRR